MRQHILNLLSEALPLVDFHSPFLYDELDSLAITTILMLLSEEYNISLEAPDATPKNLRSIDSLVQLVSSKLSQ